MYSHYPEAFEREMGCTEAELLTWLPGAARGRPVVPGAGGATVRLEGGHLRLQWQTLPPRRIALLVMPRLAVRFVFEGIDDAGRQGFMRHFDLYTQRGGG